jgi:hypothetical protein
MNLSFKVAQFNSNSNNIQNNLLLMANNTNIYEVVNPARI